MKQIISILMILFTVQVSLAQMKTIKGSVTDGNGAPIPGVNINVQGEKESASTDFDGNFSIQVAKSKTLIFSYLGL